MDNFSFYSPTFFEFGRGAQAKSGELAKRFGAHKVLIHYGGGSVVRSGLLGQVEESLKAAGIEYIELGGVRPNPRSGLVYEGIELCRTNNVDFVLAVGGGSVIDSSKAIAAGVVYNGDFWDIFCGKAEVMSALPVGTVLTIPAAGSEGSDSMVITYEDGMLKRGHSSDLVRPKFSVLNPELTFTLPPYQSACGIADMMAHVFERYFTNTAEVEITDRVCEAVLKTIIHEAPKVMKDPCDYDARANIMWAGMLAHNNTCGAGREQDWGSHQIEHELSALYDVAHGAGLAVIFPAWMKYTYKHDVMRFAMLAVNLWGCAMDYQQPENTALEGIERLKSFFASIGLPRTFSELGAKGEDIPLMASKVKSSKGLTGKFVPLDNAAVQEIYRLSM